GTPDEVVEQAVAEVEASGGTVTHRYNLVFKGFAATIPDNILTTFNTNQAVDLIEADGEVTTFAKESGIGPKK
ncbi:hypothetical protein HK098_006303, partial [Nowakowskiella sp. JEL0407]